MGDNIFKPLVDSFVDSLVLAGNVLPIIWDKWGNLCYFLIEGRSYSEIVVNEDDAIETENIKKYEYIPTEPLTIIEKKLDVVKYIFVEGEKEGVCACIGYDIEGNAKVFDILEGHTVVGGASRWGKSSFLNVLIANIIRTYTENEVKFLGCDFKKADIYYFRKYKHFRSVSTNKQEFLNQIKQLEKEMDRRADILDKANCRNAIAYNKKNEAKLSYVIFVIDELIQLVNDKQCKEILHTIMSKCASYGIYFILASQDLTKETIGRCKMNCSQVVGFHTFDQTDSDTLIGKGYDLQDINIKGRCKIKNSDGVVETQVFYIDEEVMEEVLKPFEKEANIIN